MERPPQLDQAPFRAGRVYPVRQQACGKSALRINPYGGSCKTGMSIAITRNHGAGRVVAMGRQQKSDSAALYRQGATLSRINQMVVVDILYSALVSRRKDAATRIRQTWQAVAHVGRTKNTTIKDDPDKNDN